MQARDVVLIHGLGRGTGSMRVLAWRLERAGFTCRTIGYPSTKGGITEAEGYIRRALAGGSTCHLVGHSLGGLLSARVKRDPRGLDIGRVVQLGAPNLGTPLADRLGGLWPVRRLCGPVPAELNAARHPPAPASGYRGHRGDRRLADDPSATPA